MSGVVEEILAEGVLFGVNATDWRDLTNQVGAYMEKQGLSNSGYTAAMIENVETNGPYLVIAPGTALLHARPESGCLRNGIVIGTCEPPVEFGHSVNDPVSLFLGLSATGNMEHVALLQAVALLLSKKDALQALASAADREHFIEVLRGLERSDD